jgi:hypothetical protein
MQIPIKMKKMKEGENKFFYFFIVRLTLDVLGAFPCMYPNPVDKSSTNTKKPNASAKNKEE